MKIISGIIVFLTIITIALVVCVNIIFNKIMDSAMDITPDESAKPNMISSSPMPTIVNGQNQFPKKKLTKKEILELNKKGIAYDERYGETKIDNGAKGTAKYNDPKNKNWSVTSNQLGVSLSRKKVEKFKEEASFATKAQIVKYVMGRFSGGEINEMRQIAQGGITYPEKKRLKEIVYSKFSKSEIQGLIKKYDKYK